MADAARLEMAPRTSPSVALHISTSMESVGRAWKAFQAHADCTVFQSFQWLSAWQEHVGRSAHVLPVIVTAFDDLGDPLITLPLSIKRQGPLRHLTWPGDDLGDYNGPLLAQRFSTYIGPGQFEALWRQVLSAIRSDPRLGFDVIVLQRMPERIGQQRNPFLDLSLIPNTFGAHVATLGDKWEPFYNARRPARDRKVDRRKFRNLAKSGDLNFVEPTDPEDVSQTVDLLIRQKRESYRRIHAADIFLRPGYEAFFKAISSQPSLAGVVHVTRLDVGDMRIATGLGLHFKSTYYLVLSSYEDNHLAVYSPGRAHLCDMLRWAISRGCQLFDFTIGDEPYKREWSDIEVRLFDLLEGATLLGRLSITGRTAARRANLFICERPALRGPLSQFRRQLGALRRGLAIGRTGSASADKQERLAMPSEVDIGQHSET